MSLSHKTELLCCLATRRLQNDLKMLQSEVEQLNLVDRQSSRLLKNLNEISQNVDLKLQQLWEKKIPPNERELYYTMRRDKVREFVDFIENVKQFGNKIIGKAVEKLQYASSAEGIPLSITLRRVNESLHNTAFNLSCNSSHPQCTQLFLSIYSEIVNNLIPLLSNADLSFRYLLFVERNISFTQGVSHIIDQFIKRPKTCGVFSFCQELLMLYPPNKCQTSCTQFTVLTDHLTGKLTQQTDYLDHNSDIQPIAVDRPVSQNQYLIKVMICHICKLMFGLNTNCRVENSPKSTLLFKERSQANGSGLSTCDEDGTFHTFLHEENQTDQLEEKQQRKRGRKSKGQGNNI